MGKIMDFIRRPIVGQDTTAALVYRKQWGYTSADIYGNGGRRVSRQLAATAPMNITPGPTHRITDPTVTGNVPGTFEIEPLSTIQGNLPQF